MSDLAGAGAQIVGREPEIAALHAFVDSPPAGRALLLRGSPGIGKTTLWEAAVDAARRGGVRVLIARPSDAEARLLFTALTDLLDEVDTGALAGLPAPQRDALDVALLRAHARSARPHRRAVALGFLGTLRSLAASQPLLVAIDDVQWLDRGSRDVLAYAARRLHSTAVGFLLAQRSGSPPGFEQEFGPAQLVTVDVGALSLGATRRLLFERLGLTLPRRLLRRIFEAAEGNPMFALEVGRAAAEGGSLAPDGEMLVPDRVEDLLVARFTRLPVRLRRLLTAVALSGELRIAQLAILTDAAALDDAVDAGVVVVDGERVRPSHPLLAAVARQRAPVAVQRALHVELAGVVDSEDMRLRHLALATADADPSLAAMLDGAATTAFRRGSIDEAAEFADHALRLTGPEPDSYSDRLLALAEYLDLAGDLSRVVSLLEPVERLPPGAARVRAHLLLAGAVLHMDLYSEHIAQAHADSANDPPLRASVLARMAQDAAVGRVQGILEAEGWALEALPAAQAAGASLEQPVLQALGWVRILRGCPADELVARVAVDAPVEIFQCVERIMGIRHAFRGEVGEARAIFTRLLALADERGEWWSYNALRLQLCELALRVGAWDEASRLLDDWDQSAEVDIGTRPARPRCHALLAAGRGLATDAERWATAAISASEESGLRWNLLEALRARGMVALLQADPQRARQDLSVVWDHARVEGIDDPGAFPAAPDLVEALVELGEHEQARAVTHRLRDLAIRQQHPWGLVTTERCDALVRLASATHDEQAASSLEDAAGAYERLGLRFDQARTLLILGRSQRRHRQWRAARDALQRAAAAFDAIGSPGWADTARSELSRVGARRPQQPGQLTATERRVVDLAAQGRSNKEIGHALFVSVHTVEVHLSHAYAKLGVHSRIQLVHRLSSHPAAKP